MNLQENGYMVFPRWFIQNMAEYPHPAQVCYLWLYSQAEWNQESEAFGTLETSVRDVGEATGYDSSAVSGAMNVLEGSKLIEWTRGKGRYSKSRIRIVDFFTPKTYVPLSAQKDSKSLPLDIDNSKSLPLVLPLGIDNGQSNSNTPEPPVPIESPKPLEHVELLRASKSSTVEEGTEAALILAGWPPISEHPTHSQTIPRFVTELESLYAGLDIPYELRRAIAKFDDLPDESRNGKSPKDWVRSWLDIEKKRSGEKKGEDDEWERTKAAFLRED